MDPQIEDALIEAASSLSSALGEAVPLEDYRASVATFFQALELPLREEAADQFLSCIGSLHR
jgi:hypothetical protein